MHDDECICRGNWRAIVGGVDNQIGKWFIDETGNELLFFGVVHSDDDYYYGMGKKDGTYILYSCVGSLKTWGLKERDCATSNDPPL